MLTLYSSNAFIGKTKFNLAEEETLNYKELKLLDGGADVSLIMYAQYSAIQFHCHMTLLRNCVLISSLAKCNFLVKVCEIP